MNLKQFRPPSKSFFTDTGGCRESQGAAVHHHVLEEGERDSQQADREHPSLAVTSVAKPKPPVLVGEGAGVAPKGRLRLRLHVVQIPSNIEFKLTFF